MEEKKLVFNELMERITYSNGYTCEFTDKSTGEIYTGYSSDNPLEARREAKESFKTLNPGWRQFVSQEILSAMGDFNEQD